MAENRNKIDPQKLSQKYRTNVGRLIKAFKLGLSDQEISEKTGTKLSTIYAVRQDLELLHNRMRLAEKRQADPQHQISSKNHIFLSPLIK